jgi:hypothetical protein
MQKVIFAIALACCWTTQASAALPEFGTREGELACAALFDMAYQGAKQSAPDPSIAAAAAAAWGIYVGRLSKEQQPATGREAQAVLRKLSVEEMDAYMQVCKAKASEILHAHNR